ncbi:TolC family protein [Kordiimonas sp.]|uniref:TolC family protein n=1 Tax=Kordiimonas sp. TaxID=1970157 RepID=UPI003A924540
MRLVRALKISSLLSTAVLAGCSTTGALAPYAAARPGFDKVETLTASAGAQSVWVQSRAEADAIAERVHQMVHKKRIGADTAVQVALLNNKGLQAAYAELGLSATEVWQQSLPQNPIVSVGILGIASPGLGLFRAIESVIAANILDLATRNARVEIAETRFRQAQLTAANETLRIAADTRRAWLRAVGAFETVYLLNQAKASADAASELAMKLGESGAFPKAAQLREHVFYAELTGQLAQARLDAKLAKEELTRLMGLWGEDVEYFVPDLLPDLPRRPKRNAGVEAEALGSRPDLAIARLELDATAQSMGLTQATRYVTDLELLAGAELEREIETEYELVGGNLEKHQTLETGITPQLELEFAIPIFDSGEARLRKAEFAYMRAANLLAEKAVNIRSEARAAYLAYIATYDIARHYRDNVVPLRTSIEEESLLTYNGMISNTFELLADARSKIGSLLAASQAKRDFWLAETNLSTAIYGGDTAASSPSGAAMPEGGGAGH